MVLTGPIGSGKSTVAAELADRCVARGLTVAVADLDDVAMAQRGVTDLGDLWPRGGVAHAALVDGWFAAGSDVVIAHGPFAEADSYPALLAERPDRTAMHVVLTVPADVALQRVAADCGRPAAAISRDPDFLRATHAAFADLDLPSADVTVDTTTATTAQIADQLVALLTGP